MMFEIYKIKSCLTNAHGFRLFESFLCASIMNIVCQLLVEVYCVCVTNE
jgi:hypothetical protein